VNQGPFTGPEALDKKLVDHLAYYDEFEDAVKKRSGGDFRVIKYKDYLDKRGGAAGHSRLAVITGSGLIITGRSSMDPVAGYIMGSETMTEAFRKAREDRGIKAIIFRVDSPGGSAVASNLIWRETQLAVKSKKPVIISMSDVAASGGYYVSAGATKIVSQPGTITGSIGVVAGKMVTTGFYDWIGLNRETLQLGNHAAYYYTGKRYSEEEKAIYWRFMHKIYDDFTGLVAEGRGMTKEAVDKIGQGHVWSGTRAKDLGLVDELGGMDTAIELAKKEAGIPADEEVRLVYLPEKRSLLQSLLFPEDTAESRVSLPQELLAPVRELARMQLLSRERAFVLADPPVPGP